MLNAISEYSGEKARGGRPPTQHIESPRTGGFVGSLDYGIRKRGMAVQNIPNKSIHQTYIEKESSPQ